MGSQPPAVLISYSHDSPEHEQRVLRLANRLRADGIDCTIDQYVVAPAEGWPRWMEEQIREADFVLMICTENYYQRVMGETQPGKGLGVRWELHLIYRHIYTAEAINTKFIPVLFEGCSPLHIPAPLQGTTFYFVQTEAGYEDLYRRLTNQPLASKRELGKWRGLPPSERKSEGALGRLVNVPNLPPHFLPRPGDLHALKGALLAGLAKPLALTGAGKIGVQGMGGIGKTVLAAELAHDSEVRQAFPDGIYWLTIGQKPNLLDLQNQLLRQLTGSKETLTTEPEAKNALHEALEGRPVLIVVDDVWTIDHADAFSVTEPPARLLMTTRNNEVLIGLGAEEHRVDVLSPSDALKMLAEWVGEKGPDKLPPEAAEVVRECGYLPLALTMIGAMIRSKPSSRSALPSLAWKDALTRLRRADLQAIKRAFPGYPYPDLLRAIEVSVEGLESADRERYLDLAVFPEAQPIPERPLATLWKLEEEETRDCMTRFVARSLATRSEVGGSEALILHDLQRDVIHKRREKNLPGLHLRFVEAWDALPKLVDPYASRWLAYHLIQAGRKDDLRRLLLNFNYLQAKLAATDTNALIADYDYLREEEEFRLIQSTIRLSAHILGRDMRQLPGQLTGRLLGIKAPDIQALLKDAAGRKAWPWLRPLTSSLTAPGGPLIRVLEGHTHEVTALAVTPDGHRAVSASKDRTLRVWDLESGQTVRTLEGHTGSITAVAVTPDGLCAVSGSEDQTLRVWDLESGQTIRMLEGHTDWVTAVAVTPDACRAVSVSDDGTLRLWDLENGQTLRTLRDHIDGVSAVAVISDGRRAASGSENGTLRVWDLESGQTVRTFEGHTDSITALAVTGDGRRAVSASTDETVRVWDLESGQTVHTLEGHTDWVTTVAVTPDGRRAASASADETVRVWDLESGQTVRTLDVHTGWLSIVAVTPDGHRAVSASEDRTLRVWDLESGQTVDALEGHSLGVEAVAITPDGRRAISASEDRTLWVWDLESGQTVRILRGHTDKVSAVAVIPDGRGAVSASWDGTLRVWDLESGQTVRILRGHTDKVSAVAVTPDGRRAVSASWDGMLRVWDLESGETVCTLRGHTDAVRGVAVTPDGRRAISASEDRTLLVWDLETGQGVRRLEGHTFFVAAVAVTPNGRGAVSASWDGTLRLWDLESGQTVRTLEGHKNSVTTVALTPDERRAVSGGWDRTLRVWDLESGGEITAFTGDDRILCCAFAPDGRTIIGGDESGRVHFLRLVEADKTKPPTGDIKIRLLHLEEQVRPQT